jgi:hypothetical protein
MRFAYRAGTAARLKTRGDAVFRGCNVRVRERSAQESTSAATSLRAPNENWKSGDDQWLFEAFGGSPNRR